jgi:Cu-Zn family superoxide dismutase
MTKTQSSTMLGLFVILGASIAAGCNSDKSDSGTMLAMSTGPWTVYDNPFMNAAMPNPIPAAVTGSATAWDMGGKLKLALTMSGLPADRQFGAHLHKLACDNMQAGGHYQHNPWPDGGMASDPVYANPTNEAWLDFKTNGSGVGSATVMVDWVPRAGGAKAIIVHNMATATSPMGGVAGPKLACLPLALP